jgi:hypothetical protein
MHSPFSAGTRTRTTGAITTWFEPSYGRVPALLAHEGPEDFEILLYFQGQTNFSKPECISYLLDLCNDVKQSPMRLIRLLVHLTSLDFQMMRSWTHPGFIMDIHHILVVTRRYCLGNSVALYIVDRYELARLLTHSRDLVMQQWNEFLPYDNQGLMDTLEAEQFCRRCTEVVHDLMVPQLTTFGVGSSRSIICARPLCGSDAASNHLGMYDE